MGPELKPAEQTTGTAAAIRRDLADELRWIQQIQGERVIRLAREGCYWALEILLPWEFDLALSPRALELESARGRAV
jgi:hypothetical protein